MEEATKVVEARIKAARDLDPDAWVWIENWENGVRVTSIIHYMGRTL